VLDGFAADVDQIQGFLADYRERIEPLMAEVLSVIGGSAQRVDTELVDFLRASAASLDVALDALNSAAREIRRASFTQMDQESGHVRH
jgi:hypothetical protein